jgi:hypothetical protein
MPKRKVLFYQKNDITILNDDILKTTAIEAGSVDNSEQSQHSLPSSWGGVTQDLLLGWYTARLLDIFLGQASNQFRTHQLTCATWRQVGWITAVCSSASNRRQT